MARTEAPPGAPSSICRIDAVKAAMSPSLSAKSRRETHLRKNPSILVGPNFLGVNVLLIMHDAIFWDVGRGFLRYRQRADPFFVIGLLRGRVLLLLQEHQLRIEQEATLLQQVACRPLDCQNVKASKQASPLTSSCEGDNGIQVFLPFTSRTRSAHWRQFDVRQGRNTCFAASLLPHRAPRKFVSPSTPGNSGCLDVLRTGGTSSNARAPWDGGCGPVPAAVR